jgi:hypothetical protein
MAPPWGVAQVLPAAQAASARLDGAARGVVILIGERNAFDPGKNGKRGDGSE